jgi:hypothetical protein
MGVRVYRLFDTASDYTLHFTIQSSTHTYTHTRTHTHIHTHTHTHIHTHTHTHTHTYTQQCPRSSFHYPLLGSGFQRRTLTFISGFWNWSLPQLPASSNNKWQRTNHGSPDNQLTFSSCDIWQGQHKKYRSLVLFRGPSIVTAYFEVFA